MQPVRCNNRHMQRVALFDRTPSLLMLIVMIALTGVRPCNAAPEDPPQSIVTLVTGEVLRGVIIEEHDGEVVLAHAVFGRLTVPRSSIASIRSVQQVPPPLAPPADSVTPPPSDPAWEDPEQAPAVMAPRADGAFPTSKGPGEPPRPDWVGDRIDLLEVDESLPPPGTIEWLANVQASISGVSSDTNQLDMRFAAAAERVSFTDKFTAAAEYYLRLSNSDTTDNNLLATTVYDYFFLPTDWLAFGKGQYQYDAFQDWENRLSAYAGLGYRIFHARPFALTVKGGFGATHEFGNINQTTPEAYGEVAFVWWIDKHQTIEGSVYIAPDITDFGQYRLLARLDWTFRLDPRGLSLVGGLREEFQSNVGPGSTNNDFRYYAGIRFDF